MLTKRNVPRFARRNRAFTLIELLVVIAIIAILAAILFPVFARARENARRASCMSNMKQMGLGIIQYTQDFDEKYPMAYSYINGATSGGGYAHWSGLVQPYTKSFQLFACPSSAGGGLAPTNWTGDNSGAGAPPGQIKQANVNDNQAPRCSYTANELILPRKRKDNDPANVVALSSVDDSAGTIMVAEMTDSASAINGSSASGGTTFKSHRPANGIATASGGVYDGESASNVAGDIRALTPSEARIAVTGGLTGANGHHIQYTAPDRHLDGSVFTFVDGHAKWYKLESTFNPQNFLWGKRHHSGNGTAVLKADGSGPVS